jgi:phosphohistidine swiveling domain-containing protein
MDTVLNLGLNETTLHGLIASTGNERFGWDAYRRFISMFGRIVMDVPPRKVKGKDGSTVEYNRFDEALEAAKATHGKDAKDTDLDVADLKKLVAAYKKIVKDTGRDFPDDPKEQLDLAIKAVFASWFGKRANDYRNSQKIAHDLGTAVNVVTMVFGNMGNDSGTGVAFTRDPNTGEKVLYGEYLVNAQGEDVVAGIRTPSPIASLAKDMPAAYAEFKSIAEKLEKHYRDVQDMEFTIERGRLYMLQTRSAKRTAAAAMRIAIDMVKEELITQEEAVGRVARYLANPPRTFVRRIDNLIALTKGKAASRGVAWGEIVTSPDAAVKEAKSRKWVILVRPETCPDDVHGMAVAQGILTSTGGTTSHAAVVARELGIPAVVGAGEVEVGDGVVTIRGRLFRAGDTVTIDGSTGEVFAGEIEGSTVIVPEAATLLAWAKELGIPIGEAEGEPAVEAPAAVAAPAELNADDVLRGLMIKGLVTPETLAVTLASAPDKVGPLIDGLVVDGLAETSDDAFKLTGDGRLRALDVFAADRERAGGEEACVAALDRFILLDGRMKELVTAWQIRDVANQVFNDHTDAAYDASILEQLGALHGDLIEWLTPLGTKLGRMAAYRERLERALARARDGDQKFVASPRVDSYHTVWFELHEDLIRLSGRLRSDEAAAGRA